MQRKGCASTSATTLRAAAWRESPGSSASVADAKRPATAVCSASRETGPSTSDTAVPGGLLGEEGRIGDTVAISPFGTPPAQAEWQVVLETTTWEGGLQQTSTKTKPEGPWTVLTPLGVSSRVDILVPICSCGLTVVFHLCLPWSNNWGLQSFFQRAE